MPERCRFIEYLITLTNGQEEALMPEIEINPIICIIYTINVETHSLIVTGLL